MKQRTLLGSTVSAIWCLGFVALLFYKRNTLGSLTLNEWGDFFAGAMAPLALFWLVMGYLQQGEELRLNTDALRAQQEELRRQVAETAILAENSKRQAAAAEQLAMASMDEVQRARLKEAADAMPIFRSTTGTNSADKYRLQVKNVGATVSSLTLEHPADLEMSISPSAVFESGTEGRLTIRGNQVFPYDFSISFRDRLGNNQKKTFTMLQPLLFAEKHDA